jgi:hypothetical protein
MYDMQRIPTSLRLCTVPGVATNNSISIVLIIHGYTSLLYSAVDSRLIFLPIQPRAV